MSHRVPQPSSAGKTRCEVGGFLIRRGDQRLFAAVFLGHGLNEAVESVAVEREGDGFAGEAGHEDGVAEFQAVDALRGRGEELGVGLDFCGRR